jgi:hypothetical protein
MKRFVEAIGLGSLIVFVGITALAWLDCPVAFWALFDLVRFLAKLRCRL